MKSIFKRFSAGTTGKAGEKVREQQQKKAPARKRYLVRG